MARPFGHIAIGMLLARRLGVRSPGALATAGLAATLPDVDFIVSALRHGDPWKLHRKGTHTPGFALTAGMLAGFAGVISAGSAEGERDLIADAMAGAIIVGSHVVLDRAPFPYLRLRNRPPRIRAVREALNWLIDAAAYGGIAWLLWPRQRAASP
jgi:membrane-bound metal-dependent hydrolase YbcI (DUF457 family)